MLKYDTSIKIRVENLRLPIKETKQKETNMKRLVYSNKHICKYLNFHKIEFNRLLLD